MEIPHTEGTVQHSAETPETSVRYLLDLACAFCGIPGETSAQPVSEKQREELTKKELSSATADLMTW